MDRHVTDGDRIAAASLAVLLALFARMATAVAFGVTVVVALDLLLPAPSVGIQVAAGALAASVLLNCAARRAARDATGPAATP